jgi:hypothetical protein
MRERRQFSIDGRRGGRLVEPLLLVSLDCKLSYRVEPDRAKIGGKMESEVPALGDQVLAFGPLKRSR